MTQQARGPRVHERWAHLRFSVIGQLFAAPPPKGELRAQIEALAGRQWRHPITGEPARFGFSTIERWFYRALKERSDPVGVLRRKLRTDAGQQPAMSDAVRQVVLAQYAAHKSWSVQLHHDNLVALAQTRDDLQPSPCYDTLRRFMKANGLDKRRRVTSRQTAGADRAEARLFDREVRSYEAAYVNDFVLLHEPGRSAITPELLKLFATMVDSGQIGAYGSGTDNFGRDLIEFGSIWQYRASLTHKASSPNVNQILHGVLRHNLHRVPDPVAQRVDLSDRLGFDLKDKASLPGLFLTAAMARQPDAVILISSNDPARIKSNVSSIDWDAANNRRKGFLEAFAEFRAILQN